MKQFESITEQEILCAAHGHITNLFLQRFEENEAFKKEHGHDHPHVKHLLDTYGKQLNELRAALRALGL